MLARSFSAPRKVEVTMQLKPTSQFLSVSPHELFTSKVCQTIRPRDFWRLTNVSHLDVVFVGQYQAIAGPTLSVLTRSCELFSQPHQATSQAIQTALATDGVEWRFNPPSAPHFLGRWEAAVKSVKHHLRRVIGDATVMSEN